MTQRSVVRTITAHRQTEGAGFVVRRPLPTMSLELVDPFLLIDELGPLEYGPGEAMGAPDHPHRGFETVSYILEGEVEHEDSAGHRGLLSAGDVQWMTAGSGIVHSEMPSRALRRDGGRMHGFQVWVNLPSALKRTSPRYQQLRASDLPRAKSDDGRAQVTVIAGSALGVSAAIHTHTSITYLDWTIEPGGRVEFATLAGENGLLYVFSGALAIGEETTLAEGQMAVLSRGESLVLSAVAEASAPARALYLAGAPIGEPVARYGPFVMNTGAELREAFDDYQSGRMGRIQR